MEHPEQKEAAQAVEQALDAVREHTGAITAAGVGGMLSGMAMRRARRTVRRPRLRRYLRRFGWGLAIVVLSLATCSFGVDSGALTEPWGEPVATSAEDARRVLTRGVDRLQGAGESGALRITMTEAEATSALSLGLMLPELMRAADRIPQEEIQQAADLDALRERVWVESDRQREELAGQVGLAERILWKLDPKIRTGDVQIRFEPSGEVVVAGYVQAWAFRLPGLLVVAPRASAGEIDLDFVSGRLGRMPLPEFAFDFVGDMAARGLLMGRDYAEISEIAVSDGSFTFAARVGG